MYGAGERGEIKSLSTYRVRHRFTGLHFGRDLAFALSPEGTGVQIYVVTENLEKGTVEVSES
ncbi:hypothetical protein ACSAZL_11280 [Methanosarcina sp. T3]|uniref:hypothetical protein n=1 Tax=Methanosarcina sp. T3 TaxID=3439062 RepID=UPI003F82BE41